MTLSSIQLPMIVEGSTPEEIKEKNVERACRWIEEAAGLKADITCLAELFSTRGIDREKAGPADLAESPTGPTFERLAELARKRSLNIVAPIYTRDGDRVRNSALFITRKGELAGVYHKVHCTFAEQDAGVTPANKYTVVKLDFGRVGAMICHDVSFVESARCLMLGGAEVIFFPHVQSGWGDVVWDITLRSRAIDNCVYVVSSCFSARGEKAWRPGMMMGRTNIVGQDGFILSEVSRDPGVAHKTVDLDDVRLMHSFNVNQEVPYRPAILAGRRPTTYGVLSRVMGPERAP